MTSPVSGTLTYSTEGEVGSRPVEVHVSLPTDTATGPLNRNIVGPACGTKKILHQGLRSARSGLCLPHPADWGREFYVATVKA